MDPKERFNRALKEFLKDKQFQSLEEAQAALDEFTYRYNRTPIEEFCGLSPYEMRAFLYFPFTSTDVIKFNFDVRPPLEAPFIKLLIMLLKGIGREPGGLKTTAKGNLPRALCRKMDEEYHSEEARRQLLRDRHPIMKEEDFWDLHLVRTVAEMAGFIRKYKKRFVLTRRGKSVVEKGFTIQDYFHLFKTYTTEFNWAYGDRLKEINIIQDSFLFTLYILKLYGNEYRDKTFYADLFIRAFPMVLKEVTPTYTSADGHIKFIYTLRAIERFAMALGFAETKEKEPFLSRYESKIRKTAFLDEFLEFGGDFLQTKQKGCFC